MTTPPITIPDRTALRTLYDKAIAEISEHRKINLYTTPFYAKIADAAFDAGYAALLDAISGTRRVHTVSAPVGAGKTTFSFAFIAAATQHAAITANAPYGAVFVVDEIEKADRAYIELSKLLPGQVAVWTSDHDKHCKKPEKVKKPAARFTREELRKYPVAIVTHKFFLGTRGHNATNVTRDGFLIPRALTIVDERPNEAPTLEITQWEAQKVREALMEQYPDTKPHMDTLLGFMDSFNFAPTNKLCRPGIELSWETATKKFGWFTSSEAARIAKSAFNTPGIDRLFAFGKALVVGKACVAVSGKVPCFFGYDTQLVIDRSAGVVLLDATADIDGVSDIVPWRAAVETPKARYDNLEIVHVPQHTKTRLDQYLKKASNQRAYAKWVEETIIQNMQPGEKGLVICKKVLFDAEKIPTWSEADPQFKDPQSYTEEYAWKLEGRRLCASYWGTGVGSNAWRDADVVFLFDEFYLPRHAAIANTQGLRGHRTDQGDLANMTTPSSKTAGVQSIAEGHSLRWTKQLALRGRGRVYDAHGVCGKQRLVVSADLKRFVANAHRLFPGAKIKTVGEHGAGATMHTRILEILSKAQEDTVTTKEIGKVLNKDWRVISKDVLTAEFEESLRALRWTYVPVKGRVARGKLGSRFERVRVPVRYGASEGALTAFMQA